MSEGGSKKVRLEEVSKALEVELAEWHKNGIDPGNWRMATQELMVRCEVIALTKLIKEKLDIDEDEMNLMLKEVVLEQMKLLRPAAIQYKSDAVRDQILRGL